MTAWKRGYLQNKIINDHTISIKNVRFINAQRPEEFITVRRCKKITRTRKLPNPAEKGVGEDGAGTLNQFCDQYDCGVGDAR